MKEAEEEVTEETGEDTGRWEETVGRQRTRGRRRYRNMGGDRTGRRRKRG